MLNNPPSRDQRGGGDEYFGDRLLPDRERKPTPERLRARRGGARRGGSRESRERDDGRQRQRRGGGRRRRNRRVFDEDRVRDAVERVRRGRRGAQSGYVVPRPLQVTDVPAGTLALVGDDKPLALARGGEQAPADTGRLVVGPLLVLVLLRGSCCARGSCCGPGLPEQHGEAHL